MTASKWVAKVGVWSRDLCVHRSAMPLLMLLLLAFYALAVAWDLCSAIVHFFVARYARGEELLSGRATVFLLVAVLARFGLLVMLPYRIACWYRESQVARKLGDETKAIRKKRNEIDTLYKENCQAMNVVTVFFPDAYEDDLSVAAYTSDDGALPGQYTAAFHLSAASIMVRPHVSRLVYTADVSAMSVMRELRVRAVPERGAPLFDRVWRWAAERLSYIVHAQEREHVPHVYSPSGRVCAYGQEPDIVHGLNLVHAIGKADKQAAMVLFGRGRGANLALEVCARLTDPYRKRVKGIVLEAPITDHVLLSRFTRAYVREHPGELPRTPLRTVQTLPDVRHVSFLLVVSRADYFADTGSLVDLEHALQQRAKSCALVRLQRAPRGSYATDNGKDALAYEEAALKFYETVTETEGQTAVSDK